MGRRKRWPDLRNISEFSKGVLYSAGFIIEAHDQPSIALELLETAGWSKEDLKKNRRQFEPTEDKAFCKAGFYRKQ